MKEWQANICTAALIVLMLLWLSGCVRVHINKTVCVHVEDSPVAIDITGVEKASAPDTSAPHGRINRP